MYKKARTPKIYIRIPDGAFIPEDAQNSDYRAMQAWVAAGGVIADADPLTADELAQIAKAAQDASDALEARQYAKLQALSAMTPAQVRAWVTANVNNFADAKDALTTLAVAVNVLARRI